MRFAFLSAILFCLSNYCYAKEPVISVVLSSDMGLYKEIESGFRSFLVENGVAARIKEYNLAAQGDKTIFSEVSAENPDLILAVGEEGVKASKKMTSGIPVIFSMIFDASAYSNKDVFDVSMYANQNVSGVFIEVPVEMKIAGIRKALPNVKTIGMLYSPYSVAAYKEISAECAKQGLTLNAKSINSEAEFADALNSVLSGSDCFLVLVDLKIYFGQTIKLLLLESIKKKVPVIGLSSFFTKAGAAISFDGDYKDQGRQAGEIVTKMLAGEKASNIKPFYPRKYKYSLNLATAEKMGITFPQSVIKDASEIFK